MRPAPPILLLAAALLCACGKSPGGPDPHAAELAQLHAQCVEAMLRSTCQVMTGPEAASTADVVFVAGVGLLAAMALAGVKAAEFSV